MRLNWKLKSATFRTLEHLPPGLLYFLQKRLSGRSRINFASVNPVWAFHDRNLADAGAGRIIEFGAGKSLAQNLYLSRTGIEQTVVDLNSMLELDLVNAAVQCLRRIGVDLDARPIRSLAELRDVHRIAYRAPYDMRSTDFADGAFDACISTSTFEHIPIADLRAILIELRRILRPGGIVSAHIDYSDHYEHTDKSITRLNYLRYDEKSWARHNHRNHYQNRLRHGHYVELFDGLGFKAVQADAIDPPAAIPEDVRPELLHNDAADFMLHGRFVLEV